MELRDLCTARAPKVAELAACRAELTDADALQQMNANYKAYLTAEGKESSYVPFAKVDDTT